MYHRQHHGASALLVAFFARMPWSVLLCATNQPSIYGLALLHLTIQLSLVIFLIILFQALITALYVIAEIDRRVTPKLTDEQLLQIFPVNLIFMEKQVVPFDYLYGRIAQRRSLEEKKLLNAILRGLYKKGV